MRAVKDSRRGRGFRTDYAKKRREANQESFVIGWDTTATMRDRYRFYKLQIYKHAVFFHKQVIGNEPTGEVCYMTIRAAGDKNRELEAIFYRELDTNPAARLPRFVLNYRDRRLIKQCIRHFATTPRAAAGLEAVAAWWKKHNIRFLSADNREESCTTTPNARPNAGRITPTTGR